MPTAPDEILITTGAQQAIGSVARLLVARDANVVLEDPTYLGAIDVFALAGARLVPVPVGTTGIALRHAVEAAEPALVYLVPTYQNPTGSVLPESDRREVARLSEEHGTPVIEDETLAELSFGTEPPPPIARFAPRANVLTVGSMSKLFWGGLRVGWVRGPRPVIARLTRVKVVCDLSGAVLSQALATRLLARREEVVRARRAESRRRYKKLAEPCASRSPIGPGPSPRAASRSGPAADAERLRARAWRRATASRSCPGRCTRPAGPRRPRAAAVRPRGEPARRGIARPRAWESCRHPAPDRRLGVIV